jgi:hypothetical protein
MSRYFFDSHMKSIYTYTFLYKNCMLLKNVRSVHSCFLLLHNKEVFSVFFFAGVRGETGNTRAVESGAKDLVENCKASGAGAKDLFGNFIGLISNET